MEALEYYNMAYELLKKGLGEDHSDTQYAKQSIEQIQQKLKEEKQ